MATQRAYVTRAHHCVRSDLVVDCEGERHGIGCRVFVEVAHRPADWRVASPGNIRIWIRRRVAKSGHLNWKLLKELRSSERTDEGRSHLWRLRTRVRQAIRRISCRVSDRQTFDRGKESARASTDAGLPGSARQCPQETFRPVR